MRKSKPQNDQKKTAHTQILRLFLTVAVVFAFFVVCFIVVKTTGFWNKINSIEKIKKIVESGGVFSFIIFVLLQILQTTILQIPSIIVTLAGTLVFGKWTAFMLSFISVVIGSVIMFWIGRKAGKKFLNWFAGDQQADKWINRMTKGKYLFFLMMLFPLFPDDILCCVAGLTNMTFGFFFTTTLISRFIGVFCAVFFGSGAIIPFSGWGLVVWGAIIVLVAVLFYVSVKYKNKIDNIVKQFTKKKK